MSAKDGSDLARDVNRLHRWAEHFAEVNCGVIVSEAALEGLPVIVPCLCPENVSNAPNNEELNFVPVCQKIKSLLPSHS